MFRLDASGPSQQGDWNRTDEKGWRWARRSYAGRWVNRQVALQNPAVFRAVAFLSSSVGKLPWRVREESGDGSNPAVDHPVDRLLHLKPGEMNPFQFKETAIADAVLEGNFFAEIVPSRNGVAALERIAPGRVDVRRDDETGEIYYAVAQRGGDRRLAPSQVFHLKGLGSGLVGLSVIEYAAHTIGWAEATAIFGARFFRNGLLPSGFIELEEGMSEEAIDELMAEIEASFMGVENSWRPIILDKKAKWNPASFSPNDGQFIETRKLQNEEISRWFGVPLHKLNQMDRATFSNIEHQSIEVVMDSIHPWVQRLEEEANLKLLKPPFFSKMNMNALMRGDSASRATYYQTMTRIGAMSVNDVRRFEDMNTIGPEGDVHLVQSAMAPLKLISEMKTLPAAQRSRDIASDN